jgi:nitroimidazol reductase NimA-like FMN-containing flavoprotein (pyridoxamine 5'-phosphate oxidase superfamily)
MSDTERDEFLEAGGTGVVSFARGSDDPPYSLPVSYGYDAEDGEFCLRLAFGPDSRKVGLVGEQTPVSLVVHREQESGWASVVVTGHLSEVTEVALDSSVAAALRRIEIPLVDVFDRHPREYEFRLFRLVTDEVSGKKQVPSDGLVSVPSRHASTLLPASCVAGVWQSRRACKST